ncbi:MAG: hypothetical protein EA398_08780 [Deltaproteobacteria bacterium]|nr:MAG: hypothetical protein EA398_08780 [Deltaproteobacteria bacterium]
MIPGTWAWGHLGLPVRAGARAVAPFVPGAHCKGHCMSTRNSPILQRTGVEVPATSRVPPVIPHHQALLMHRILPAVCVLLLVFAGCSDDEGPAFGPSDPSDGPSSPGSAPSDPSGDVDSDVSGSIPDVTGEDPDVSTPSEEPSSVEPTRTPTPDEDELDAIPDDGSLRIGDVCRRNGQCETEFCPRIAIETIDGICTTACELDTDCPDGWGCVFIATSGADAAFVCIDPNFCIDRDGDGYGVGPGCDGPDCDDGDPEVFFGAPEFCDGKDNSCNGIIDDRPIGQGDPCEMGDFGICNEGIQFCRFGELQCEPANTPQVEVCNGLDMNCDGTVDSGNPGGGQPCSTDFDGVCGTGETRCVEAEVRCVPTVEPGEQEEICNGLDMNCDGTVDTGFEGLGDICFAGEGICARAGAFVCDPSDPTADPICSATPGAPAPVEQCDYQDDNCDGEVDGAFRNAQGLYASVEHCGACNLDCNNFWPGGPEQFNVVPTCEVTGGIAQCGFECAGGYVDADGVAENGCELLPDAGAIYVSRPANGGTDGGDCGAWDSPCATITFALTRAQAEGRERVRVSDGVFRERVTMVDGISLLGGHNSANWTRNPEVFVTLISGVGGDGADRIAVRAESITQDTVLSGFTIQAENAAPGGNSIGVYIRDAGDGLLMEDNQVFAGRGGNGAAGQAGSPGTNGTSGSNGALRTTGRNCGATRPVPGGGGSLSCENLRTGDTINVSGGSGGEATCPSANTRTGEGMAGEGLSGGEGGLGPGHFQGIPATGGTGGTCSVTPALGVDPVPGSSGAAGTDGNRGSRSGNASGSVADGQWRGGAGGDGQAGLPGSGGGGGSAAAGVFTTVNPEFYFGATGGGGGSGGCGGAAGRGGAAGGGSFAVFISQSSATDSSDMPRLRQNTLNRGQGGDGGAGGNGGGGGDGSLGGSGGPTAADLGNRFDFCMLAGGSGGSGGRGGHGGGGAGGNGGASFDIFVHNGTARPAYANNNTFTLGDDIGTGGNGGVGGNSSNTALGTGQNGSAGLSGQIGSL